MTTFEQWAARWGIPPAALQDLAIQYTHTAEGGSERSESRVQSEIRLEAAAIGCYLWRNNVGAGHMKSGGFIRFGLGNDSAQLNEVIKSGDLIGWRKRLVTADMLGTYVAQFVSREIKRSYWKYSGTTQENAQLRWATLVNEQGGDAKIVTGSGSFS